MGRLVILSGPSCAGKGPLYHALQKFYPELARRLQKIVLYNSRSPRPSETNGVDYHFRTREEIEDLDTRENYVVLEARADLQAIDLNNLQGLLAEGDAMFEGNPYVARELMTCSLPHGVERLSIFIAPLSKEEIIFLKARERSISLENLVSEIMRKKLLRRNTRQKQHLSLEDYKDIEKRATLAYSEMKQAYQFDYVIPNHDGEDSENWGAFYYPLGDARKTILAFVGLLEGSVVPWVEKWEQDLLK